MRRATRDGKNGIPRRRRVSVTVAAISLPDTRLSAEGSLRHAIGCAAHSKQTTMNPNSLLCLLRCRAEEMTPQGQSIAAQILRGPVLPPCTGTLSMHGTVMPNPGSTCRDLRIDDGALRVAAMVVHMPSAHCWLCQDCQTYRHTSFMWSSTGWLWNAGQRKVACSDLQKIFVCNLRLWILRPGRLNDGSTTRAKCFVNSGKHERLRALLSIKFPRPARPPSVDCPLHLIPRQPMLLARPSFLQLAPSGARRIVRMRA